MEDFIYISAPAGNLPCMYINSVKACPGISLKWLLGKQIYMMDFTFSL